MALTVVLFIVAILVIAIWLLFGFKRIKHKFFAIFLIFLVLFSLLSFMAVFGGKDISINNISDVGNLAKTYFLWLGNIFGNLRTLTGNAIKMNWNGNQTG